MKEIFLSKKIKQSKNGITLIALVVTIVVLLILATVSIQMLGGENGIIKQAVESKDNTIHANVREQLQLEVNAYFSEKNTGSTELTLIEYLQAKQILGNDIGVSLGKYQVNITKLLGSAQKYGNGTATESEKKDVYMLERQNTSTGSLINAKVATIEPIKIATAKERETYKIIYYGGIDEVLSLGDIVDIVEKVPLITFTIGIVEYQAEEGMTWKEWVETDYNTAGASIRGNLVFLEGRILCKQWHII